ncbi:ABC transporter ATP-binding protein [Phaeobacter gallaeciensis]|uniref:Amino acid/amide ABC transporter ATP-binding protein 2, HAAT family n=1 Tax=Phaeobacter gallaeciensis TaxID=60890 RepID=A0AAC9ZBP9_9RHOB|nr:ABC transporter ATP-binding protein [Phaeobacter gallaeciensis]AHD11007.1 amino acid/amide ABC transporter ATP-binding protein 2, HAAT family [Phaeobacter gallaeciensis DSM 26640]ATE94270.1 amino acid/amide ABC transporter ATP-binding protein 2, HAAT family [Phaeobacter gallaeciensis]ATE95909.1 amino acid/amide ABC transporter ATP-binding protein 2, HAAT family [Phaeobacter gallaeciensis]ATF02934.1 amino acid/amide ABC transporter ATP-binding protein 2, HAAT family [Phaeobacter gallaeciensis
MLRLSDVNSLYGKSHILFDVSIEVGEGEIVTLLGRNGAGKSTTLNSIMGLVPNVTGAIEFGGQSLIGMPTHKIAELGICLIPEQRDIFQILTVEENLLLSQKPNSSWSIKDIYDLFPRLEERKTNGGGQLSGGEQQMLAIARALLNAPKILLCDEPSEGLAPVIIQEIVATLEKIKSTGMPILLVEQNLRVCEKLADRHYIFEQGQVLHEFSRDSFFSEEARAAKQKYLSV